jgi:hypothetical protein
MNYEPYDAKLDRARREWEYEETPELDEEERRDYKAEALAIGKGESLMLAERGHLLALYEELQAAYADIKYLWKQNEMLRTSHPAFAAAAPKKPAAAAAESKVA